MDPLHQAIKAYPVARMEVVVEGAALVRRLVLPAIKPERVATAGQLVPAARVGSTGVSAAAVADMEMPVVSAVAEVQEDRRAIKTAGPVASAAVVVVAFTLVTQDLVEAAGVQKSNTTHREDMAVLEVVEAAGSIPAGAHLAVAQAAQSRGIMVLLAAAVAAQRSVERFLPSKAQM